jgi:hypothetical protein
VGYLPKGTSATVDAWCDDVDDPSRTCGVTARCMDIVQHPHHVPGARETHRHAGGARGYMVELPGGVALAYLVFDADDGGVVWFVRLRDLLTGRDYGIGVSP